MLNSRLSCRVPIACTITCLFGLLGVIGCGDEPADRNVRSPREAATHGSPDSAAVDSDLVADRPQQDARQGGAPTSGETDLRQNQAARTATDTREESPTSPVSDGDATTSRTGSFAPAPPSPRAGDGAECGAPLLDERLANLEIPPRWLAGVETHYDTSKPWKEARLEIRRLLSLGNPETHREALKLTWIYLQKHDIGNGHEYPMYTFLGGEPLWSIRAHEQFLAQSHENTPIYSYVSLASLYTKFGAFEKAKAKLDAAMAGLPAPPWRTMREAEMMAAYGDVYAAWGKVDEAKKHYARAIALYPKAKPPYGGHLLPRRAAKVQAKLDRLTLQSLQPGTLRDGHYRDKALGYAGDIDVTVTVQGGRITDVRVQHKEKIDQNACVIIPREIVQKQSVEVDGISGATATVDAIVNGTFRALKKAGRQ